MPPPSLTPSQQTLQCFVNQGVSLRLGAWAASSRAPASSWAPASSRCLLRRASMKCLNTSIEVDDQRGDMNHCTATTLKHFPLPLRPTPSLQRSLPNSFFWISSEPFSACCRAAAASLHSFSPLPCRHHQLEAARCYGTDFSFIRSRFSG